MRRAPDDLRARVDDLSEQVAHLERQCSRYEAWARMHQSFRDTFSGRAELKIADVDKIRALRIAWNAYAFKKDSPALSALGEAVVAICGRRS